MQSNLDFIKRYAIYTRQYLIEIKKNKRKYKNFEVIKSFSWFQPWIRSNLEGKSPLEEAKPWITFPAIEFLEKYICEGMRVFEYGTGGSTLFFLRSGAKVISVEHDRKWAEIVKARINHNMENWSLRVTPPKIEGNLSRKKVENPEDYVSGSPDYQKASFKEYVQGIDFYSNNFFDIILIDGRARPSCFLHSLNKVKAGGIIIWDNTDRTYYHFAMDIADDKKFEFLDFPGPSPYVRSFTRTSIWLSKLTITD